MNLYNYTLYLILDTRYGKVDATRPSFKGSDMDNSWRRATSFKANITAMGACSHANLRDIGLVAPSSLTQGYEKTLRDELCKY